MVWMYGFLGPKVFVDQFPVVFLLVHWGGGFLRSQRPMEDAKGGLTLAQLDWFGFPKMRLPKCGGKKNMEGDV